MRVWLFLVLALVGCGRDVQDGGSGGQAGERIVWTGKTRYGGECSTGPDFSSDSAYFEVPQHVSSECGEPANCQCSNVSREISRVGCWEVWPDEYVWGDCHCRGEWPDGAFCDQDSDCQHECVEGICATRCATDADCLGGWVCEAGWGNVPDLICQVPCCSGEECVATANSFCTPDLAGRLRCAFDYDRRQFEASRQATTP